jgi:pimeloyl-ACP methyl ester carboxylesterase
MSGMERLTVAGLGIDVRSAGSGRDLLFLHPGSGLRDHDDFLRRLAGHFCVTAPAHPGFDGSDNQTSFARVTDLAFFYLDLIETLALDRPLIVGASLGAWIAAELAVSCRHACAGLTLIGPLGAKFGSEREREITDLFSYPIYEQEPFLFSDARLARRSYADANQQELMQMARNFETFARLGWSPTLFNPQLRSRLARLNIPALVMRGENDRVVSADYARKFAAAIPGATFESIPQTGHYAHIERAEYVCAQIATFADRADAQSMHRAAQ